MGRRFVQTSFDGGDIVSDGGVLLLQPAALHKVLMQQFIASHAKAPKELVLYVDLLRQLLPLARFAQGPCTSGVTAHAVRPRTGSRRRSSTCSAGVPVAVASKPISCVCCAALAYTSMTNLRAWLAK